MENILTASNVVFSNKLNININISFTDCQVIITEIEYQRSSDHLQSLSSQETTVQSNMDLRCLELLNFYLINLSDIFWSPEIANFN